MTEDERFMLGRIEERVNNIYHLAEKTEQHLSTLNGTVQANTGKLQAMSDDLYGKDGKSGLCAKADKNAATINRILIGLAVVAGGGGIGAGIYEIVKAITLR